MFSTRCFNYKFLGPTTYLGPRVKIQDKWFEDQITLSFDYRSGSVAEQAIKYLESLGFKVLGHNSEYQIVIIAEWKGEIRLTKNKE